MLLNGYIELNITQCVGQINITIYDVYIHTILTFFGKYLGVIRSLQRREYWNEFKDIQFIALWMLSYRYRLGISDSIFNAVWFFFFE